MKKMMTLAMMTAVVTMTACTQDAADEVMNQEKGEKTLTFRCDGDFVMSTEKMTRSRRALEADGKQMTDLWVLDYVGGELKQQLHQTSADADFGQPALTLNYGTHQLYFVCSRGKEPAFSADEHSIVWGTPSDTFWKSEQVNVSASTNDNLSVTLGRVATKLSITIEDAIPEGAASVVLTPEKWYYGLDYTTGTTVSEQQRDVVISLPASYAGRTGTTVSVFGLSGASEWTTNVSLKVLDDSNVALGQTTITSAPFKANRTTCYKGRLFGIDGGFTLTLNSDWDESFEGEW